MGRDATINSQASDSATASMTPGRTPSTSTPSVVPSDRSPSRQLIRARSRSPVTSNRPSAETNTTAARAAVGTRASGALRKSSTNSMVAAATMLTSWVLPPTALLTAVRESAPVTGKPWASPEARLLAPNAISSWLASIS